MAITEKKLYLFTDRYVIMHVQGWWVTFRFLATVRCCRTEHKEVHSVSCDDPAGRLWKAPAAESILSTLKLQLDCGLCSSDTYKESLSHKPTQAEETWAGREGGREEKVTSVSEHVRKQASVYQQKHSWAEDEHKLNDLKFSLVVEVSTLTPELPGIGEEKWQESFPTWLIKGAHHLVIAHSWPCNLIYRHQMKSRKMLECTKGSERKKGLMSAFLGNAENSIIRQSATMSAELALDQRRPCDRK